MLSGEFFAQTGKDLRRQPAHLVYDFGLYHLMSLTHRTEDEVKAENRLEDTFVGLDFEDETGLPSIARSFGPADGSFDPYERPPVN